MSEEALMAAPSFRTAVDERRIAQIRQITHELPASCSDFLRGIAMTTSTFTRLAYALDLRTFFHYLAEERVAFADKPVTQFTDADIERISQKDLEDYAEFLPNPLCAPAMMWMKRRCPMRKSRHCVPEIKELKRKWTWILRFLNCGC